MLTDSHFANTQHKPNIYIIKMERYKLNGRKLSFTFLRVRKETLLLLWYVDKIWARSAVWLKGSEARSSKKNIKCIEGVTGMCNMKINYFWIGYARNSGVTFFYWKNIDQWHQPVYLYFCDILKQKGKNTKILCEGFQ